MSSASFLPDYDEIKSELEKASVTFPPSQIHGIICGIICAEPEAKKLRLEKWVEIKNRATKKRCQQLYADTYQQLNEFSFEFNLLLPSDEEDINLRTEALGLWCQGFLAGLSQDQTIKEKFNSEVQDAIDDITEIAQVNYGEITENETDETAYFELVEYVRLAVLMIFQELR